MESIEQRASSWAGSDPCDAYEAGAKEERILVVEWMEKNMPQLIVRFKADFGMELPKYYGDDDGRAE